MSNPMPSNIIEAIQEECRRVREVLLPEYEAIGPVGTFGKLMLNQAIRKAESAIASGDVVQMAVALSELRGCE